MKNINNLGVYEIGSIRIIRQLTSRTEAICVRLRKSDKKLSQYKYTLEELRDLESKLVLISGEGSAERKDVDLFLDVSYFFCQHHI